MVNIAQIILGGIILAIIAGASYLMHMFFGMVGVGLLIAFLLPVIGLMAWLGGGNSSGNVDTGNRRSKGARARED